MSIAGSSEGSNTEPWRSSERSSVASTIGHHTAGWDCHAHVFGPYDRFPLSSQRSYTPPEASQEAYIALLDQLGLTNGVLVHPSAYGSDFSLLFDALSANSHLRGVVVVAPDYPHLNNLRGRGVCGARFSHRSGANANFAGSASFDDLCSMASALADANLHAELWTDTGALRDIAPQLRNFPIPVVLDHMGGFDPRAGVDDAEFRTLLSLLETDHVWIKLCAYRNLSGMQSMELGLPFHRAMLAANADRLVWGSDWPHLRITPAPDTAQLLQMFKTWTSDEALVDRILVRNPQTLYG